MVVDMQTTTLPDTNHGAPIASIAMPWSNRTRIVFAATFLTGWFALDRLVTSPPNVLSATAAAVIAGGVVGVGDWITNRGSIRDVARRIGLGRPARRAILAASAVGGAVVATYLAGAALLGIDLELRSNWPNVLVGALLFHGFAEELVWRGYAFGRLRSRHLFWRAVAWSVPLIALTHVPIIAGNGIGIGGLAVLTAAATSVPFAALWERSGGTVWAAAILHGLIGTWQLFEHTYSDTFSVVVIIASIFVPFTIFLFRDRSFDKTQPLPPHPSIPEDVR
jgi:membrane protease YdiL (CAAX protease family)